METLNKNILKWKDYVLEAATALEEKNFEKYEQLMALANEFYEKYKEESKMYYESRMFGVANYLFEESLPEMIKNNKKAIKEFIETIKEDKNLLTQFNFIKSLEKYDGSMSARDYINEALTLSENSIDFRKVKQSNKKLANIVEKNNFIGKVPQDLCSLYESCDYILTHKKKISNINEMNKHIGVVEKYLNEMSSDVKNREKFENLKTECLNIIKSLVKESNGSDAEKLNGINNTIKSMSFNKATLDEDIDKMIEIKEILIS